MGNPCSPEIVAAMGTGILGLIDQPNQAKVAPVDAAHAAGAKWCADNGCFSARFDEGKWWAFLTRNVARAGTCLFAVAPDVVGDAQATLERSLPWLPRIRALGYPAAFVAQDGLEHLAVPWDEFDCLFLGGSTAWKLGPDAERLAREAKARGKWVHAGRVNSRKRYQHFKAMGCDSADGTFLTFAPKTNLPRVLRWFED